MNRVGSCSKGAVYVEFIITFVPMFFFFLCIVQFTWLEAATVILKHTAEVTARTAIVVLWDDPKDYCSPGGGNCVPIGRNERKRKEDIERAAQMVVEPLKGKLSDLTILMKSRYERDEMVEVTLKFDYTCRVPVGRMVVCGGGYGNPLGIDGSWSEGFGDHKKRLTAKAALPGQGADYDY
jgi:hypothetical protein